MPSSVSITSPTSGSTVEAGFNVGFDYTNDGTSTVFVLLRCEHAGGGHSQVAATVAASSSGSGLTPVSHTQGFTGATLVARLQLTTTWGDAFITSASVNNITINAPDPG